MVRRIVQISLIVIVGLLVVATPIYAVSVANALYAADLVAQNTGDAVTDVAAVCDINTQALIDGKYVTSDLLNTAIQSSAGSDLAYMPGVGTNPWVFCIPNIGASEQKCSLFYCGGPAMQTGFPYYFPGSGGMTTPDSDSLELGNNFTIEQKGYVDTSAGSDKNLVYKEDAFRTYTSSTNEIRAKIFSGDTFIKLTDPTTLPASTGMSPAFTADGTYLAVALISSPYIIIYKRTGDTFTKLTDPTTLPAGTGMSPAFTADGTYLAVAHNATPFVTIYKRSGDTFIKLTDPADLPASTGNGAAFTADGTYLAVAHNTTPFVTIYKRTGDTFTKLTDPTILPADTGRDAAFTADGLYLAVAHNTTPFVTIYKRSGDTFTKLTDPTILPTGNGNGAAFTPDGLYLAVAHNTTPFVTIYKREGDAFTKLANPADLPASTGNGAAFTPDGLYLAVAHANSPFVTIYEREGDAFTKLTNPADLPAGTGQGAAFSSDGLYLAVAHTTTPFVTIYKNPFIVVTVTGISSGEHIIETTADGTDLTLSVTNYEGAHQGNSPQSVALGGASVSDNDNGWSFATNGSVLYLEYHKIWVGGTLKQHIIYERAYTFQDQTAYNNDATPTFRTTSSDPDVSVSFENFRPIKEARCTIGVTEELPEMLTEVPDEPPEIYGEEGWGLEHLPGAKVINVALEAGNIPPEFFWIWLCYGMAALGIIGGYHFIRSSLLFPTIIGFIVILFFALASGGDPIPLWTIIPYSVISAGMLVSERVFGW